MNRDEATLLSNTQLFRSVPPESVSAYLDSCRYFELPAGEILISPNQPNDCVFVVLEGRMSVHLISPDEPALTTVEQGACAGDMSILRKSNPSAFVVVREHARLCAIPHETVWALINVSHAFARNLFIILSERIVSDNELIADSVVIASEFQRLSVTDSLTDLPNRRWINEMFAREIERCRRSDRKISMILLDIDGFAAVNNELGHLVGDRALRNVATALRRHFRPNDMIARFGGDEFAVLLPDTNMQIATQVANRVLFLMNRDRIKVDPSGRDDRSITLSMGVAQWAHDEALAELIDRTDSALYRAKNAGRNRVCA